MDPLWAAASRSSESGGCGFARLDSARVDSGAGNSRRAGTGTGNEYAFRAQRCPAAGRTRLGRKSPRETSAGPAGRNLFGVQQAHRAGGCSLPCPRPARAVARGGLPGKIREEPARVLGDPSAARRFPGNVGQRRRPGLGMVFRGPLRSPGAGFCRFVRTSGSPCRTQSGAMVWSGTCTERLRLSSAAHSSQAGSPCARRHAQRPGQGCGDACSAAVSAVRTIEPSVGRAVRELRRETSAGREFGSQPG